jgi:hypothetical protein
VETYAFVELTQAKLILFQHHTIEERNNTEKKKKAEHN